MNLRRALLVTAALLLQAVIACDAFAARGGNRSAGAGMSRASHAQGGHRWHGGHRHYHHGGGYFFGASLFAPYWWFPPLPYYSLAAPIYLDEYPFATPLEPGFWYYCHSAGAYYPGVAGCPEGWEQVAPAGGNL